MGEYLDFENEKHEKGYKSFQLTRESAKANIGKRICYVDYVEPYRGTYFVRYGVIHSVFSSRIYLDEHKSKSVDIRDVKECGIKIEEKSGSYCKLCGNGYVDTLEKKKKVKTVKKLEEELWKIFSEFIRRRDAKKFSGGDIVKCVTCPKVGHWKQFDAGHFISRKFKSTKYHEKNNNCQCKGCNGPYGSGKQFEHGKAIDRMYGEGTADMLFMASRQNCKRSAFEYEILINEYKQKLKEL